MHGNYLKNREPLRARMLSYLEKLQNAGTELFVDGEAVLPGEAVRMAVEESELYMADYVLGENGAIKQVRFDRVEP